MIVYEEIFKKYGLSPTQQEIIKTVGKERKVLEIGSSAGYMTRAFLDNGCIVDVVEPDREAIAKLPKNIRKIFNTPVENDGIYEELRDYEFIIMADVLEHLINPEMVLEKLHKISAINTKLLISLPNVACWDMRKKLFFKGDFEYQESGLLDKTHLHFYSVKTLPKILSERGWKTEKLMGTITRLPLEGLISKIPVFGWIFKKFFYQRLVRTFKNLAYYHFLTVASKT
ncbi:MAG: class I SAM-dependent methyltransferase [Candidatus Daviesbacteria bacterium]|nr:class I SAM-dependent methyltransferase [Candidatus Daviesbacteria bacterium]